MCELCENCQQVTMEPIPSEKRLIITHKCSFCHYPLRDKASKYEARAAREAAIATKEMVSKYMLGRFSITESADLLYEIEKQIDEHYPEVE